MFKVSYQGKSSTLIQFIKLDGLSSKETLKYNGGEPILHFPENNCQKLFLYKYGLQNDIFFSIDLLYITIWSISGMRPSNVLESTVVPWQWWGEAGLHHQRQLHCHVEKVKIPDKNEKYLSGHVND